MLPARCGWSSSTSDDAWMRDTGPTFVVDGNGGRRGVDWRFNAWGGIYSPWDRDDRVAAKVLEVEGDGRYRAPLVLEGGSIHVDGEGTVLTTEECLLNPNRNPELTGRGSRGRCTTTSGPRRSSGSARRLRGRDRRPRRQPRLLRPARGRAAHLDRGPGRSPARDLPRRPGATRGGDRRPRPPLRGDQAPRPRPAADDRRGGGRRRTAEGTLPRRAGDRLAASYVNFYIGNSRIVIRCSTSPATTRRRRSSQRSSPTAR